MANTKIPVELSSTPGIVDNSNATAITIDASENVGVGDTSPIAKLTVKAASDTIRAESLATDAKNITMSYEDSNDFGAIRCGQDGVADKNLLLRGASLLFQRNGGTEAMRIDSSGHVGIGMTPAPVGSDTVLSIFNSATPRIKLHNSTTGSTSSDGAEINMSSSDFILENREAGNVRFFNNGSERMRIDSSGNVGIGVTSSYPLTVQSGTAGSNHAIALRNNSTNNLARLGFLQQDSATAAYTSIDGDGRSTGYLRFNTNDTERMRIDSNGDVQIGTTSQISNAKVSIVEASTDAALFIRKSDGTQSSTNTYIHFDISGGGTAGGKITFGSGGSPQFTATSDARLKENIKDVTGCLDKVMALKPSSFTFTESNLDVPYGFIAQNVETVLPEFVSENEQGYKQISDGLTSGYVAVLTKAIQEQQAQIEALQSEINELKNS